MEKAKKSLVVRFPERLHRAIKLKAYEEGSTIQEWVLEALSKKLESKKEECRRLCEVCGGWRLKGTQMAMLGTCEICGKEDVAVFPMWEKK